MRPKADESTYRMTMRMGWLRTLVERCGKIWFMLLARAGSRDCGQLAAAACFGVSQRGLRGPERCALVPAVPAHSSES
jgi:hypothetical protein